MSLSNHTFEFDVTFEYPELDDKVEVDIPDGNTTEVHNGQGVVALIRDGELARFNHRLNPVAIFEFVKEVEEGPGSVVCGTVVVDDGAALLTNTVMV